MGALLGLGLSHYPGPIVAPEYWPRRISRNVEVGRIAPELFAAKDQWPARMREEWGDDEGQTAARKHSARLVAGYAQLRRELDAFAPDLVFIWGDDQYENFRQECVPPFCVGIFDEVVSRPYDGGRESFSTDTNVWGIAPDAELRIKGHREAALDVCRSLLDGGFDVSYSFATSHPKGLAHSFNNTILYLDYEQTGFPYPVIPFHVNCYGNELMRTASGVAKENRKLLSPPAPSPRRCFDLGRATARFFADSPWRVALIGSSSWSHASLTTKNGRLYPDTPADSRRLAELKSGGFRQWGELTREAIVDAGQHEILNWICLAGAMTEAGQTPLVVDYVESCIFNSAKCFAVFPPAAPLSGVVAADASRKVPV
jgi:catalytic LigB subunit of aromatic ring-opening dioxygenase